MNGSMPVEGWHVRLADPRTGRSFSFVHNALPPGDATGPACAPAQVRILAGFSCEDVALQYSDVYGLADFEAQRAAGQARGNWMEWIDGRAVRWRGGLRPKASVVAWRSAGPSPARPAGRFHWDFVMEPEVAWAEVNERDEMSDLSMKWSVTMLEARVAGTVDLNGYRYDVGGWRGYQDHWWGARLPEEWLWVQCFFADGSSLALATSSAGLSGGGSGGCARLGLWDNGRLYTFEREKGDRVGVQRRPPDARDGGLLAVEAEDRAGLVRAKLECQGDATAASVDLNRSCAAAASTGWPLGAVQLISAPCRVERYQRGNPAGHYGLVNRLFSASGALVVAPQL